MTDDPSTRPSETPAASEAETIDLVLAIFLALHGAIHLIGFALCWELREWSDFRYEDVSPEPGTLAGRLVGLVWLAVAAGFILSARLLMRRSVWFRPVAIAAAIGSVLVGMTAWPAASPGVVASAILLVAIVVATVRRRRWTTT